MYLDTMFLLQRPEAEDKWKPGDSQCIWEPGHWGSSDLYPEDGKVPTVQATGSTLLACEYLLWPNVLCSLYPSSKARVTS
jgi:hypothetical protein